MKKSNHGRAKKHAYKTKKSHMTQNHTALDKLNNPVEFHRRDHALHSLFWVDFFFVSASSSRFYLVLQHCIHSFGWISSLFQRRPVYCNLSYSTAFCIMDGFLLCFSVVQSTLPCLTALLLVLWMDFFFVSASSSRLYLV